MSKTVTGNQDKRVKRVVLDDASVAGVLPIMGFEATNLKDVTGRVLAGKSDVFVGDRIMSPNAGLLEVKAFDGGRALLYSKSDDDHLQVSDRNRPVTINVPEADPLESIKKANGDIRIYTPDPGDDIKGELMGTGNFLRGDRIDRFTGTSSLIMGVADMLTTYDCLPGKITTSLVNPESLRQDLESPRMRAYRSDEGLAESVKQNMDFLGSEQAMNAFVSINAIGSGNIPFDLYVDDRGRMRHLVNPKEQETTKETSQGVENGRLFRLKMVWSPYMKPFENQSFARDFSFREGDTGSPRVLRAFALNRVLETFNSINRQGGIDVSDGPNQGKAPKALVEKPLTADEVALMRQFSERGLVMCPYDAPETHLVNEYWTLNEARPGGKFIPTRSDRDAFETAKRIFDKEISSRARVLERVGAISGEEGKEYVVVTNWSPNMAPGMGDYEIGKLYHRVETREEAVLYFYANHRILDNQVMNTFARMNTPKRELAPEQKLLVETKLNPGEQERFLKLFRIGIINNGDTPTRPFTVCRRYDILDGKTQGRQEVIGAKIALSIAERKYMEGIESAFSTLEDAAVVKGGSGVGDIAVTTNWANPEGMSDGRDFTILPQFVDSKEEAVNYVLEHMGEKIPEMRAYAARYKAGAARKWAPSPAIEGQASVPRLVLGDSFVELEKSWPEKVTVQGHEYDFSQMQEIGSRVDKHGEIFDGLYSRSGSISESGIPAREDIIVDWKRDRWLNQIWTGVCDNVRKSYREAKAADKPLPLGELKGQSMDIMFKAIEGAIEFREWEFNGRQAILLGEAVKNRGGCCRHMGLLAAVLIRKAIDDGIELDGGEKLQLNGKAYYIRDHSKDDEPGWGHGWAGYITTSKRGVILDVAQNRGGGPIYIDDKYAAFVAGGLHRYADVPRMKEVWKQVAADDSVSMDSDHRTILQERNPEVERERIERADLMARIREFVRKNLRPKD